MATTDPAALAAENERLARELEDLRILNETTVDHSTTLENELMDRNAAMDALQNKMKKYLSPQLYEALVGGAADAALAYTRKKLTVFFSDIVGFSEITDSIESEVLSEVLNSYLDTMANIATKWGGTIDKFIGDAVMVFFGDPEFIDDVTHAQKCVQMAIEMRERLHRMRVEWRELGMFHPLRVRMGINSGYCTVGNFGSNNRMDYTIVGGQVNIASRLERLADPDSIYISSATNALVHDMIDSEYVDNMHVKGIHYPVEVYRVIGLRSESSEEPLLKRTKQGFALQELSYDALDSTAQERERLTTALRTALQILKDDGGH